MSYILADKKKGCKSSYLLQPENANKGFYMLSLDYSDLSIGIQELKKRFDSIRIDLQYLSYTAEGLIKELQRVATEIEDLGNDIQETEIIA